MSCSLQVWCFPQGSNQNHWRFLFQFIETHAMKLVNSHGNWAWTPQGFQVILAYYLQVNILTWQGAWMKTKFPGIPFECCILTKWQIVSLVWKGFLTFELWRWWEIPTFDKGTWIRRIKGRDALRADIISCTHLIIRRDPGAKTQSREPFVTETKSKWICRRQEMEQFHMRQHWQWGEKYWRLIHLFTPPRAKSTTALFAMQKC